MIDKRHPIRLATIQTYLFARALRHVARAAAAELQERSIDRNRRIAAEFARLQEQDR